MNDTKCVFWVNGRKSLLEDLAKTIPEFRETTSPEIQSKLEIALNKLGSALVPPMFPIRDTLYSRDIGYLAFILLSGRWMMRSNYSFAYESIKRSLAYSYHIAGARVFGLGSLSSPATEAGTREDFFQLFLSQYTGCSLVTGNALTAVVTVEGLETICKKRKRDVYSETVAVVGASGSTGSGICSRLVERGAKVIAIARSLDHLKELQALLPKGSCDISTDLGGVSRARTIVVAISSADSLLHEGNAEILAPETDIYDITQPSNCDPRITIRRPDVCVYKGGIVKATGYEKDMDIDLEQDEIYACLAETMLFAINNITDRYHVGKVTKTQMSFAEELLKSCSGRFSVASPRVIRL